MSRYSISNLSNLIPLLSILIFPLVTSWQRQSVRVEGEMLEPIALLQSVKYRINLSLKIVMILGAGFISIAILVWFKTRVRIAADLINMFER